MHLRANQTAEEARSVASWALCSNKHLLGRFVRRSAYVGATGHAKNILTVIIGEAIGEESHLRDRLDYHRSLVLDEVVAGVDLVQAAISRSFVGLPIVGYAPPQGSRFTTVRWPSDNGLSQWPATVIWNGPETASDIPYAHEPVTGPGDAHAYYPDMHTAAAFWCGLSAFGGATDTRAGGFILVLPELRGRISGIVLDSSSADVEVTLNAPRAQQWRLKGGCFEGDGWKGFNICLNAPTTRVPFGGVGYQLALVDDAGNIVDHWFPGVSAALRNVTRRVVRPHELIEHVTACLEQGECDTVEFKPIVVPGAGGEKFERVIATAIAFANTGGGTVLFGVSDVVECRDVLGSSEFKKWRAKTNASEDDQLALSQYGQALVDGVRRQLDKPPEMKSHTVCYGGANLVMLRIEKGAALPYYDRNGVILVRRGASVRPAHPDREPHLFAAAAQAAQR